MTPPARAGSHLDAVLQVELAGTSRASCPLLPTPSRVEPRGPMVGTGAGGAPRRLFFQPHWSDQAVEDALEIGNVFKGKLRVNAHNRNEAYCTIDGIPVDILITGTAQNRAGTKVVRKAAAHYRSGKLLHEGS